MCKRKYYGVGEDVAILTYVLASRFSVETIHNSEQRTQYAQNFHKSESQKVAKKNAIFLNRILPPIDG